MTISADEAKALLDADMMTAHKWVMRCDDIDDEDHPDECDSECYGIEIRADDRGYVYFPIPNSAANARLICAAPDLAATVIELSERIDKVAFFHPTTHGKPCGICEALGRYDEAWTQGGEPK